MDNLELAKVANEVRKGVLTAVHGAKSGHPGGSLSAADIFTYLYFEEMNIDPADPKKEDRDRFVLSKGHTAPGLYSALAHRGFFPVEDLETLRHLGSYLQGHPCLDKIPGVDMSTGSLGQGVSAAVGMALGGKMTDEKFRVYSLLGDGEIQEGQVWEMAMFAAHRKLGNLIGFTDYNKLQIDGATDDVCSLGDIVAKYKAFGWDCVMVNGHDVAAIHDAIEAAKTVKDKPSMIILDTIKGKGISALEGKASCHNANINAEQCAEYVAELDAEAEAIKEGK